MLTQTLLTLHAGELCSSSNNFQLPPRPIWIPILLSDLVGKVFVMGGHSRKP